MSSDALARLQLELVARGVELSVQGDKLRVRAPKGALDRELQQALRDHKQALLDALAEPARVPLSSTQRQLWLGEQLEPGGEAHLLVVRGRIRGPLDVARLERALARVLARHESLRTQFETDAGVAYQRVLAPDAVRATIRVDADPQAGSPSPDAMTIDLGRAPLLRVWLGRRGPQDHAIEIRAHHLILDGAALEILLDELGRAYAGGALEPPGLQLRALVTREAAREREPDYGSRLAAWVEHLGEARPLALPADRPRQATPSSAGARVHVRVEAPLWRRVRACARANETTAFVVVASALGLVCQRWTGRERVWVGVPHSNRNEPERARAVASVVETTLLELDGRARPELSTYLARVRDAWLRCLDHTDLALDRVIAALGVRQLPDLTLNFIPFAALGLRLPGAELELRGRMPGARFDLTVYAYPRAGGLELELAYRSSLFEAARIEAFASALVSALEAMTESPSTPLEDLPLRPAQPPPPARPSTPNATPLRARIEAVEPGRVALRGPGGERSYADVRARASAFARALAKLELDPGARVAILARRRLELAPALLGVWEVGQSALILDAEHPPARLADQARAAAAQAWISTTEEPLPAPLAKVLAARPRVLPDLDPQARAPAPFPPDDAIAWLPFTSGTTGRPRGVLVDHGALRRTFAWYIEYFQVGADERFALLAGLGHDPMLRDLILPLAAGASVCIPPDEPARMGPELGPWLAENAVSSLHLTPPLARIIARHGPPLPRLRRVIFGGAPLRGSDLARWRALAPAAAFYNGYGATESPQLAALHPCSTSDETLDRVALGRGVAGSELQIVRDTGTLAAVGELGEIVIVGPNLARAYLPLEPGANLGSRPSLDLRLDTDPRTGLRSYRSGDLGRIRADGAVEFVGRRDRQLELRGHRIAAAEVELALLADPQVREAAVGVREGELLAALVGPKPSALPGLRAMLETRLPAAMIPSSMACVDALPLTANAKLDLDAVWDQARAARGARAWPAGASGRPSTELELALAALWSSLLGVPELGLDDDFFALGGHSLLGVELVARVDAELSLTMPVSLVFEHPRLADMAAALAALRDLGIEAEPRATPTSDGTHDESPASSAQTRLWLLQGLDPDAPQLLLDHDLELDAALDLDRLDAALVALERRHEPLRTHFRLDPKGLVQIVGRARASILERFADADEALAAAVTRPFILEHGPVWRALAWTERGRPRLRIQLHHIAGDAASMAVFIADLCALYRGQTLAELPLRYRDLVAWREAQREREDRSLSELRDSLAELRPAALPLAFERPARQRYRGARVDRRLDPATSAALLARASASGATAFMAALTALVAVLARAMGSSDLALGTPVGLRPHPRAAGLVGPFLNLAIIRTAVEAHTTLAELLERVRGSTLAALARAHVPFERVLEALAPTRALDRTPLVQVLFNMVDRAALDEAWSGLGARRRQPTAPSARYDLAVYADLDPVEGLGLTLVYDRDLFRPAQLEQLGDHLLTALSCLAAAPETSVANLPLARVPGSATPTGPTSVHAPGEALFEAFEASARRHDSRAAITCGSGGESIDYADLAARARALAARLAPFAPGTRIGLVCEHDATMVAALLASLARGLTYVPLDPRLPLARLVELGRDAELGALASTAGVVDRARALRSALPDVPLIELDADSPSGGSSELVPIEVEPDTPAYILYTSGSTGRPKGVVQSQRNLVSHARRYAASIELEPGEGLSVVASFAFDAAIMDIYGGLLAGARLVLIDLGQPRELARLGHRLASEAVAVFHATPTVFRELLAQLDEGAARPALRCVVLGGEEARAEDAHGLRRLLGSSCTLINGLGPTECTLALQYRLSPDAEIAPGSLPIGRALPGLRAELRTPLGDQVAIHGVGELVLDSPAIALGYWRRPELSAAAFTSLGQGRRRYATGDLAERGPEGLLRFVGRRDGQVQIRGRRVELGEIEARLRANPQIREAGVSLRGHDTPWLAAHVTLTGAELDSASALVGLAAELPAWMVPRSLTPVDALAKTATGKLDRRALARLATTATAATVEDRGPGPREPALPKLAAVVELWSRVLGIELHEPELDLFALGGDSLAAVRLHRALRRELDLELELAELFEGATPTSLARRLDARHSPARPAERSPVSLIEPPASALAASREGPAATLVVLPPGAGPRLARELADALVDAGQRPWLLRCSAMPDARPAEVHEALADVCVAPLHQLPRPLRVLGISNGGLLALLIGSRLPHLELALLDTLPPTSLADDPWPTRGPAQRRAAFLAHWAGIRVSPETFAGPADESFTHMREVILERSGSAEAPDTDAIAQLYAHYEHHAERVWQVLSTLELPTLTESSRVLLFAAQGPPKLPVEPAWRASWPKLAVHAAAGDHLTMLGRAHVRGLVVNIDKAFASLQCRPEG